VKRLVVLGSTGSIGTQSLAVVERHPETLAVEALAAGRNVELLVQQAKQFRPRLVCVAAPEDAARVRDALGESVEVACGAAGLVEAARRDADLVIGALVGSVGLEPVLAALARGTDVALANKEVLVMAGALVVDAAARSGARVLPLDSEHAAIHQCLAGHPRSALLRLVLTASGGPFRTWPAERIAAATPEQALAHPNWEMGPKISVDSATLMNKGLEVIEARWLFDVEAERIEVVVHPESIVHALVEYVDGSWLAELSVPDMRIPIAYLLGLPERLALPELPRLDLAALGSLRFEPPDLARFPALGLAAEAARRGGTAPAVLNAANEVAVGAFLERRIPFAAIAPTVADALDSLPIQPGLELAEIRGADRRARERAASFVAGRSAR
jgi:1-deoxy-D-xylulose-5-phosphate reductoisomerase